MRKCYKCEIATRKCNKPCTLPKLCFNCLHTGRFSSRKNKKTLISLNRSTPQKLQPSTLRMSPITVLTSNIIIQTKHQNIHQRVMTEYPTIRLIHDIYQYLKHLKMLLSKNISELTRCLAKTITQFGDCKYYMYLTIAKHIAKNVKQDGPYNYSLLKRTYKKILNKMQREVMMRPVSRSTIIVTPNQPIPWNLDTKMNLRGKNPEAPFYRFIDDLSTIQSNCLIAEN